ncbi:flavin reductase family protein [Aminobacter sp. HY435]|uniref:flavin reductase family protein n=1 Tax=Aminobacter sp. HY435 TaxID=2970917 RepID=UPI0022B9A21F|nr:flavin reductase family protein [Aminobacter sp. HY435]
MMSRYLETNLTPDPPFQPLQGTDEEIKLLKRAYGCFPSGVVAVSAVCNNEPICLVASSFVAVSIDPPLVAFCVQWTSQTWASLKDLPRVGISVLGDRHNESVRRLASRAEDKFDQLGLSYSPEGAVFVDGATAWLDCAIEAVVPAGDHGIVLLRVDALTIRPQEEPLVFHGSAFRSLQKVPSDS